MSLCRGIFHANVVGNTAFWVLIRGYKKMSRWRENLNLMSKKSQDEALLKSVKHMRAAHPNKFYFVHGAKVCRKCYAHALGIGQQRLAKLLRAVSNHSCIPPEDKRTSRIYRPDGAAYTVCDWFFLFIYNHLQSLLAKTTMSCEWPKRTTPFLKRWH